MKDETPSHSELATPAADREPGRPAPGRVATTQWVAAVQRRTPNDAPVGGATAWAELVCAPQFVLHPGYDMRLAETQDAEAAISRRRALRLPRAKHASRSSMSGCAMMAGPRIWRATGAP
jgi:hypothetical protein